jgi:hypothetical protein
MLKWHAVDFEQYVWDSEDIHAEIWYENRRWHWTVWWLPVGQSPWETGSDEEYYEARDDCEQVIDQLIKRKRNGKWATS